MIKKYRLKQLYPGSPYGIKVGDVVNTTPHCKGRTCKRRIIIGSTKDVAFQNYPNLWEEISLPEYEILSFYNEEEKESNPVLYKLRSNGNYFTEDNGATFLSEPHLTGSSLDSMLEDKDIYSIKRLSDGEIFSIGDKCNPTGVNQKNQQYVTKIWITVSGYLRISSQNFCLNLNTVEHTRVILFTTEDGVDIYEGDSYFGIQAGEHNGDQNLIAHNQWTVFEYDPTTMTVDLTNTNIKRFKDKLNAENYVLLNKPCLSLNDVSEVYVTANRLNESKGSTSERIQTLTKTKL